MTPSPKEVGSGIFDPELEAQVNSCVEQIDSIIINARATAALALVGRVRLNGIAADRQQSPAGEEVECFHPLIVYDSYNSDVVQEDGENLALGGRDFKRIFAFDYDSFEIYWGGKRGKIAHKIAEEDRPDPFRDFLDGKTDHQIFLLPELDSKMREHRPEECESFLEGKVASFLLPPTADSRLKLETAKRILFGLQRVGALG